MKLLVLYFKAYDKSISDTFVQYTGSKRCLMTVSDGNYFIHRHEKPEKGFYANLIDNLVSGVFFVLCFCLTFYDHHYHYQIRKDSIA